MAKSISAKDLRDNTGDLLNQVHYQNQFFQITKWGRPVAALVPFECVELLARQHQAREVAADGVLAEGRGSDSDLLTAQEFELEVAALKERRRPRRRSSAAPRPAVVGLNEQRTKRAKGPD